MDRLKLYHVDGSYFSQRVRYALVVKGLKYSTYTICMPFENLQPWFLKINPEGQVPAIVHGNQAIVGSYEIMKYLDDAFPETLQLFPSIITNDGKRSKHLIDLLTTSDKEIRRMTYGTIFHPECTVGSHISSFMAKKARKIYSDHSYSEYLQTFIKKYPQYTEIYKKKLKESNLSKSPNLEVFEKSLKNVEKVIQQVEEELANHEAGREEMWLLGKSFTGADIILAVLLHRINYIGMSHRLLNETKYPNLVKYYKHISQQEHFLKGCYPTKYSRGVLSMRLFPSLRFFLHMNRTPIVLAITSIIVAASAVYYKFVYN